MRQLYQCLLQQLQQLETEQERIGEAIIEVQRRKDVLDEVTSWSGPREEPEEKLPLVDNSEMWMRKLSAGRGSPPAERIALDGRSPLN